MLSRWYSIGTKFNNKTAVTKFNEFGVYFTHVISIDNAAFFNCHLAEITFPTGLETIGASAFTGCYLVGVTLPASVTKINSNAFNTINFPNTFTCTCLATTPPTLGASAFRPGHISAIYVPAESVDTYKSANGWSSWSSLIQAIPE